MSDYTSLILQVTMVRPQLKQPLKLEVSKEDAPACVFDLLGVSRVEDDISEDMQTRLKRCNELTNLALVFGDAPLDCHLIHGSIHGPYDGNERIQHSWLTIRTRLGELVWEPARAGWFEKGEWYKWARAWDEREYTRSTAMYLTEQHGHYGPWHESRYP